MIKSSTNYIANSFSHIYIENSVFDFPITQYIINRFPRSKIVRIENYNEVFSRKNQNPYLQKLSPSLIVGEKKEGFFYKGSRLCHNFEEEHFYYTNFILNCLFDCDYCYLKGMNLSSNIVFFVNLNDYFNEIARLLNTKNKLYLSISYDSDILIFDEIYPFLNEWYNFVEKNPKITVEIRTKSVLWKKFIKYKSLDNLILSWSLAPSDIIVQYEKKTPSLEARLNAISQLLKRDWKINLALDPLIYTGKPWKIIYKEFLEYLVTKIDINLINSITVGVFRIPINYLRRMKSFSNSPISFFPYETVEGVASYPKDLKEEMLNYVVLFLERYFNRDKIYIK
ncbi:MAG: spore photoproduct lyase family protein [Defluviitoga tunisiensis]